jgi:hypothetical protein
MKQNFKKIALIIIGLMTYYTNAFSQSTLEMTFDGSTNPVAAPTTTPITVTFLKDALNANSNTVYSAYTPALTATMSFRNQQRSTLLTNTTTTLPGLMFGARTTGPTGPNNQQAVGAVQQIYDVFGAEIPVGPLKNGMYTSSPSEAPVPPNTNYQTNNFGRGLDVEGITGATGPSGADANFGVALYSTVEPLFDINAAANGRFYYGDLVIKFNRPVKDPVIHIGGLGGSFNYQPITAGPRLISYFTTELELTNTGLSSTFMAGNEFLNLVGNNLLNSAPNPNGGSVNDGSTSGGFNNYGAASGSIRITGTVQELVYRVYVRGSNSSQFNFSVSASSLTSADRDPFNGDLWYLGVSLDKPTQQISGTVFLDKQIETPAATTSDITKSFGISNDSTNAGGPLYAYLVNTAGNVVQRVLVSDNGLYIFNNVANGTYTVRLSTALVNVGLAQPAASLPAGWVNTGEKIGRTAGDDGATDGTSISFTISANEIKTDVNFGIKTTTCLPGNNILFTNPTIPATGYFGGFEFAGNTNFYPTGVNFSSGNGFIFARTPLAAGDYSITANASSFSNTLGSYNALGGNNQMVVKPSANNQTAYYIVDSAGKNSSNIQSYFKCQSGSNFRGWLANASGVAATVRIKIYDADDATKVFGTQDITLTGVAGNWIPFDVPWIIGYCPNLSTSATKKIRLDIISIDGQPFSIDELCLVPPPATLPINVSEFTVSKTACTANLAWKTSTEGNSDRFEVEVSSSNNPVYTTAGSVTAAGYSTQTKTYRYSYPMQAGVVYFFRLKLIDKDGSFKYSDIVSASCTKGKGDIVILPNPVKTTFYISGMEKGKNSIVVYAANGQLVKTQAISQDHGEVDISYLAPGMYTVKITSEAGNTVVNKLIKY